MDFIQQINEYFKSDKFRDWFNSVLGKRGFVTVKDVFDHAEQDGILAPGDFYGSSNCGWIYPLE